MIVILGLLILGVAAIVGAVGVLANTGADHALTGGFAAFGYHVTGSTGALFLYGLVVGAIAMFGLWLLSAGLRRASRRRRLQRNLARSRRETVPVTSERDDLADTHTTVSAKHRRPRGWFRRQTTHDRPGVP